MSEHVTPPSFALRLLSWFCPDYLYEEIEGDLIQYFYEDVTVFGVRKARRRMIWSALRFFRPGIILRNKFVLQLNKIDLLISHLRFAIRLFRKDKLFSTLNVMGLALGIGVSILLALVLQYDLTYDQHYENHDRIYRLGAHIQSEGVDIRVARATRQLCEAVKYELPEVEAATRINVWGKRGSTLVVTEYEGKHIALNERSILRTDSDYFKVFHHQFLAGDPRTCFKSPNSVVITASTAKKFFGTADPIGKSFQIGPNDKALWPITGVIEDLPGNTHLKFNILLSGIETVGAFRPAKDSIRSETFWNPRIYVYMLLPRNYQVADFESKWQSIYIKYFKPFGDKLNGNYSPILQRLDDIHFHSDLDLDEPVGNMMYTYAFTGIGIFIVLLACINYMNLSTAKAARRAPEIGMKKALGSGKDLLAISFLGESVFFSFISMLLAIVAVIVTLRFTPLNNLIARDLVPDFFHNQQLLLGALFITLLFGVTAGLYPALYLPAISTVNALKGGFKSNTSTRVFRRMLIATQFVLSILVVVCTLFMQDQISYMRNKDLGFDKDNVLVVPITDSEHIHGQLASMKHDLSLHRGILGITQSQSVLGWANTFDNAVIKTPTKTGTKQNNFTFTWVGEGYLKAMNMKLIKGRDFLPGDHTDIEWKLICNETGARLLGLGDDPIGKQVNFFSDKQPTEVIGVVKDFNYSSLHNRIEPLIIIKYTEPMGFIHLKVSNDQLPETVAYVKKVWDKHAAGIPLEYFFLDQRFDEQYRSDETQSRLLKGLSYVCIFISFLGIVGLSAFTVSERTQEIGVRKVMGATIPRILVLLSKDVLFLVLVSSVLVIPLSQWVITQWQQNFAYHTQLNYYLYVIVTLIALALVFLTVLFQSLKTVRSSPVESLKHE